MSPKRVGNFVASVSEDGSRIFLQRDESGEFAFSSAEIEDLKYAIEAASRMAATAMRDHFQGRMERGED